MTKEEINIKIQEAMTTGLYRPFTSCPTVNDFNDIILYALPLVMDSIIIDVYCSPAAKLHILRKFWLDDFNYLGSRIRVISEENLITGKTTIPGMSEKYNYLVLADGVAVGYAETLY